LAKETRCPPPRPAIKLDRVIPWTGLSSHWHDDYERGRPGYPRDATRVVDLPRAADVVEIAVGTGKLTRLLLDHFTRVLAVEPDPEMRLRFTVLCPTATLVGGTAEQLPLADSSTDAVFIAEAFHWFAHERALVEIARVLRPGGALVLLWNRPTGSPEPPITAVEALLEPTWPANVQMPLDLDPQRMPHARDWPDAFARSTFEPLDEATFANPHRVDRDGLVAYFGSMGWISTLPERERTELLDEVRSRLTADDYVLPFETHVHWTRRPPR
jgi:SAM-dependent methyltransferase